MTRSTTAGRRFRARGHYPVDFETEDGLGLDGLTKRELFAAMAMQGILANGEHLSKAYGWPQKEPGACVEGIVAHAATRYSNALLAELEKQND